MWAMMTDMSGNGSPEADSEPISNRPHIPRRSGDWVMPTALPVTIKSYRTFILWTIIGCNRPLAAHTSWTHFTHLARCCRSPVLIPLRMNQVGFRITDTDLRVTGYFGSRKVGREGVVGSERAGHIPSPAE